MADSIVLYPSPGIGHLISMVELGKLISKHHPSLSIIIVIFTPPYFTGSTADYIASTSASSNITFHTLPTVSLSPTSSHKVQDLLLELPALNNPNLHQAFQSILQSSRIKAFIVDFFNDPAHEVATSLNIPTYYFFTTSATGLASFLYFPTIHQATTTNLKDLNILITTPGVPPIRAPEMPEPLLDRSTKMYKRFLNIAASLARSRGVIVNTFELLEAKAIKAIADGLCVPDGPSPPVYCIGPLIANSDGHEQQHDQCLNWLSGQPDRSVVFLCFGSMGLFSAEQMMEMAIGLEKSGHRFLWVVRSPSTESHDKSIGGSPEPDLDMILPKGFLDRTKGRGLVVKSWAPQVAVLNHKSVGGFVTHCGWNSILEAICGGVPMLAWPLYAEQKMNRVLMVEEMKVALKMTESKKGFVSADELEKRVRELMESETGKEVRKKVLAIRDAAMEAMKEGGSSHTALAKLGEMWTE